LAESAREIYGVVGWADLCSPGVADRLAWLREGRGGSRLVGLRHQVQAEPDPNWLGRPDVRKGLRAVGEAGLVYDFVVRDYQLPAVIDTVSTMSDVRFVLDHGAKPDIANGTIEPWKSHVFELARFPNVAVKLSGLVTEADHGAWTVDQIRPYAEAMLDAFGPHRTMWGSDWPVCLLAASYADVLTAAEYFTASLSADERRDIFGGTARRWYALEPGQLEPGQSGGAT
jgi:L-fuconolactonase